MKKFFVIGIAFCFYSVVFAHPGRTDSDGGHTCNKNCEEWGLKSGEYHYHEKELKQVPTAKTKAKELARQRAMEQKVVEENE